MKIIVCVKQVPDPNSIDFHLETGRIDRGNISYIENPHDYMAIDEAIRIKEEVSESEVTAITVGPSIAEKALRNCLLLGADKAIHICSDAFEDLDAKATSIILAKVISTLPYDMIFCGKKSIDMGFGYVGPGIAELLDLPQVSSVTKIQLSPDRTKAIVCRRIERQYIEVVECRLPAVFIFEKKSKQLRHTPLSVYMAGLRREIIKIDPRSLNLEPNSVASTMRILGIFPPKPKVRSIFTIDSKLSVSERMKLIMSGGIEKKEDKVMIEDSPEEAADQVVQFLVHKKIIV